MPYNRTQLIDESLDKDDAHLRMRPRWMGSADLLLISAFLDAHGHFGRNRPLVRIFAIGRQENLGIVRLGHYDYDDVEGNEEASASLRCR